MIKKVVKLNKELFINKKYEVVLSNKFKTIRFDKLYFGELERFWIDQVSLALKTRIFERMNCNDSWFIEIAIGGDILYFDLYIVESEV